LFPIRGLKKGKQASDDIKDEELRKMNYVVRLTIELRRYGEK